MHIGFAKVQRNIRVQIWIDKPRRVPAHERHALHWLQESHDDRL